MLREIIEAFNAGYILEPEAANQLAQMAYLIRSGKIELTKEAFNLSAQEPYIIERKTKVGKQGHLSVLSMEGTMFRNDMPCGPMGYLSMAARLEEFDQDNKIDAHLFKAHTPGGQIEGLETFANVIANTRKPVVIFGENIFSAGVYAAVGSSAIVLSGKNARMGSIGVQSHYRSLKKMLAEKGIEEGVIKATTSPDKNNYNFEKAEDRERFAKEVLDPLDAHFMDHVKAHRPGVDESALTGKTYFAQEAIELGLADHIGTFESAAQLALDMAGKNETSIKIFMTNKPEEITAEATNPETTEVSPLQLQFEASQTRITALEEMVSAKDNIIGIHLQTIEDQRVLIQTHQAEIKRLEQLPAADIEAEVTTTKLDISTQMEKQKPQGLPLPPAIQAAIDSGKKRRERHEQQGTFKQNQN